MCDLRHQARRLSAAAAVTLALGLVSMHGADAHAVSAGHALMAAPGALVSEVHAAVSAIPSPDGPLRESMEHERLMVGHCVCLLALVGFALASLVLARRAVRPPAVMSTSATGPARDARSGPRRRGPPPPASPLALGISRT